MSKSILPPPYMARKTDASEKFNYREGITTVIETVADEGEDCDVICGMLCETHKEEETAAFIVRAANCHAELVAALEWARTVYRPNDDSDLVKAIDAALAKAKGGA